MPMTPEKLVEIVARHLYQSKNWDDPDRGPGEKMKDVWRDLAKRALSIAAPILRNEAARDAFRAGFWAWNGPSNEAELDRDIAMEQEAWEEYAASLKTKDKPE
jgi:hypothetical protein